MRGDPAKSVCFNSWHFWVACPLPQRGRTPARRVAQARVTLGRGLWHLLQRRKGLGKRRVPPRVLCGLGEEGVWGPSLGKWSSPFLKGSRWERKSGKQRLIKAASVPL